MSRRNSSAEQQLINPPSRGIKHGKPPIRRDHRLAATTHILKVPDGRKGPRKDVRVNHSKL